MTHVLDDKKQVFVKKDRVICRATIGSNDFNNPYDLKCPARFFFDERTFEGVAVLKEGDPDNVREAIHIAESKMERKFYKFVLSRFKVEKRMLENSMTDVETAIEKNARNVKAIDKHIVDIVESLK